MCRPALIFCLAVCLTAVGRGQSFEETFGLQPVRVSLLETVHRVLEKSLDAKIEWLNWAVADAQTQATWGKFEPSFFLSQSVRKSALPQNALEYVQTGGSFVALTEPNIFRQESIQTQAGISGRLPIGTEYKFFTGSGEFRNDLNRQRPPAIFYPEYAATAGFTITQPLLRDFGPSVNLAEVRVARRNRAMADYKWEQQLQEALGGVILEYFDLVFALENIEVKRGVVAFAKTLVTENEKRLGVGVLSAADVQEAEVAVAVAQEDVITALSFAVERQMRLKSQTLSSINEGEGLIFLPSDPLPGIAPILDRSQLLRIGLTRRPSHRAAIEEAEKQAIVVKYMRNQLLPRLDLQSTLTANGLNASPSSAYDRVFARQGYEAQVGLQLSVPLGNRTARANHAAAEYRQQQAILAIARSELNLSVEIDTLIGRIKAGRAKLESTRESVKLAERLLETERKRHEQGLARSFDVLKARRELADARTRQIAALAEYNKAAIQLAVATGTLLERYGIEIERGQVEPQISFERVSER